MSITLTKTDYTISALHKLVSGGEYKGFVNMKEFELVRLKSHKFYRVKGKLNENNEFVVETDFIKSLKILVKTLNILGVLTSLILAFVISNWTFVILYFVLRLFIELYTRYHEEREIRLFSEVYHGLIRELQHNY